MVGLKRCQILTGCRLQRFQSHPSELLMQSVGDGIGRVTRPRGRCSMAISKAPDAIRQTSHALAQKCRRCPDAMNDFHQAAKMETPLAGGAGQRAVRYRKSPCSMGVAWRRKEKLIHGFVLL